MTTRFVGDTVSVKSGTGTGFTFNVTIVDCTGVPPLPVAVIVTGNEPVGVSPAVVIVSVDDPDPPVNVGDEKVPLAFAGRPFTEKLPLPE